MPPTFMQWQSAAEAAYTSCQRAAPVRERSYIECLPAELRLLVIENLPGGDLRSLINLALTGPVFYHSIFSHEASLAENVVVSAVGADVMPIAASIYELEGLGDKLPRAYVPNQLPRLTTVKTWNQMLKILDRHSGRGNHAWHTQSRITKFSVAAKYLSLDVAVKYWAKKVANRALKKAYSIVPRQRWRDDPASRPGINPKPAASEMARFCKALYIYQFQSVAFPWPLNSDIIRPIAIEYCFAFHRFWHDHPPWEFEQVRQVEILLGCDQVGHCYLPYPVAEFPAAYSFIFEEGLKRMRVLDAFQPFPMRRAMAEERWMINHSPPPIVRVPAIPGDYMPLEFRFDSNNHMNLHAGEIFKKYSEGDDGPKFWWYYNFLLEYPSVQVKDKYQLTSACRFCSFMLGYVFWDFDRLRKMTREKCPSIDDLLETTQGISVDNRDVYNSISEHSSMYPSSDFVCNCMIGKVRY